MARYAITWGPHHVGDLVVRTTYRGPHVPSSTVRSQHLRPCRTNQHLRVAEISSVPAVGGFQDHLRAFPGLRDLRRQNERIVVDAYAPELLPSLGSGYADTSSSEQLCAAQRRSEPPAAPILLPLFSRQQPPNTNEAPASITAQPRRSPSVVRATRRRRARHDQAHQAMARPHGGMSGCRVAQSNRDRGRRRHDPVVLGPGQSAQGPSGPGRSHTGGSVTTSCRGGLRSLR